MNFITHNDLGMIDKYVASKKISVRFKRLLNRIRLKMSHILADVHPSVRHIDDRIARELSRMSSIRVLDTVSYRDTISQKRAASKKVEQPRTTLKELARNRKRKLCRALKRNESLRSKVVCVMYEHCHACVFLFYCIHMHCTTGEVTGACNKGAGKDN